MRDKKITELDKDVGSNPQLRELVEKILDELKIENPQLFENALLRSLILNSCERGLIISSESLKNMKSQLDKIRANNERAMQGLSMTPEKLAEFKDKYKRISETLGRALQRIKEKYSDLSGLNNEAIAVAIKEKEASLREELKVSDIKPDVLESAESIATFCKANLDHPQRDNLLILRDIMLDSITKHPEKLEHLDSAIRRVEDNPLYHKRLGALDTLLSTYTLGEFLKDSITTLAENIQQSDQSQSLVKVKEMHEIIKTKGTTGISFSFIHVNDEGLAKVDYSFGYTTVVIPMSKISETIVYHDGTDSYRTFVHENVHTLARMLGVNEVGPPDRKYGENLSLAINLARGTTGAYSVDKISDATLAEKNGVNGEELVANYVHYIHLDENREVKHHNFISKLSEEQLAIVRGVFEKYQKLIPYLSEVCDKVIESCKLAQKGLVTAKQEEDRKESDFNKKHLQGGDDHTQAEYLCWVDRMHEHEHATKERSKSLTEPTSPRDESLLSNRRSESWRGAVIQHNKFGKGNERY